MKDFLEKHILKIFIAPILIFIVVMVAFPLVYMLYLSFTQWSMGVTPPEWIGFGNYVSLLKDEYFLNALWRTVLIAFSSVAIEIVLGVALALFLNREFVGKNISKTFFLLPMVATPIAVGMVWLLIYEPTIGVANFLLKKIGLKPVMWLVSAKNVLPSLIIIEVWEWTPMIMLIILAGLAGLPRDPFESAMVDGANRFQMLTKITLPLLRPTIIVAALLRMIDALKTFDIIYSTTQGGPLRTSETLNIYAYTETFSYFHMGRGSASIMLFLIVIGICSALMIVIRKHSAVEY